MTAEMSLVTRSGLLFSQGSGHGRKTRRPWDTTHNSATVYQAGRTNIQAEAEVSRSSSAEGECQVCVRGAERNVSQKSS